jgi:hypothetical protein
VDATNTNSGEIASVACSQSSRLPWTMLDYDEARAACQNLNDPDVVNCTSNPESCWDLCSADQWEYACSFGHPVYPYGETYQSSYCNGKDYNGSTDELIATGNASLCRANYTSLGESYNAMDMSGNVEEWTRSSRTINSTTVYEIRGGSYNDLGGGLTCDFDFWAAEADFHMSNLGFRCCRGEDPGDACSGVTCDSPPSDYCVDSETYRDYEVSGDCLLGTCYYEYVDRYCEDGCESGECRWPSGTNASYIWIANTAEGTVSKINTRTLIEEARYQTGPNGEADDPSRTSVNLHGDMVVTNRATNGSGSGSVDSSVTKIAGSTSTCVDSNGNGQIDTSTGPTDVKAWGQDECVLWRTVLTGYSGARATAWDGTEDPDTGAGGHVMIGTVSSDIMPPPFNGRVYRLNGDTGAIEASANLPSGMNAYGGAIDGDDRFWIVNYPDAQTKIARMPINNLNSVTVYNVGCGYGITVDSDGMVWTSGIPFGQQCVSRFNPTNNTETQINTYGTFNRGLAAGVLDTMSEGYIWIADTSGYLVKVDMSTLQEVDHYQVASGFGATMIGAAIDVDGYVWTVNQAGYAYKFDPSAETYETVSDLVGPYTYSDMTGTQLSNAVGPQ